MSGNFSIPRAAQPDFLAAAQALLPMGDAWTRDADANLTTLLNASVGWLARFHAAAATLTEQEAQPGTADELLPAWEAAYGLPDPCTPLSPTIAQRQAALLAKIAQTGKQSTAYYEEVAVLLGYTVNIATFTPFRFGGLFGSLMYGEAWQFVWQVNVTGDSLGSGTQIGCVLNRIKPAYSVLIMNYEVA
jgi:uncharacterized protein YmfQ (DUF2313 family)